MRAKRCTSGGIRTSYRAERAKTPPRVNANGSFRPGRARKRHDRHTGSYQQRLLIARMGMKGADGQYPGEQLEDGVYWKSGKPT